LNTWPENLQILQYWFNLVNIFSEILNNIELDIETSSLWLPYTINVIIDKSIELPTVSLLYKILTIIFQELDW